MRFTPPPYRTPTPFGLAGPVPDPAGPAPDRFGAGGVAPARSECRSGLDGHFLFGGGAESRDAHHVRRRQFRLQSESRLPRHGYIHLSGGQPPGRRDRRDHGVRYGARRGGGFLHRAARPNLRARIGPGYPQQRLGRRRRPSVLPIDHRPGARHPRAQPLRDFQLHPQSRLHRRRFVHLRCGRRRDGERAGPRRPERRGHGPGRAEPELLHLPGPPPPHHDRGPARGGHRSRRRHPLGDPGGRSCERARIARPRRQLRLSREPGLHGARSLHVPDHRRRPRERDVHRFDPNRGRSAVHRRRPIQRRPRRNPLRPVRPGAFDARDEQQSERHPVVRPLRWAFPRNGHGLRAGGVHLHPRCRLHRRRFPSRSPRAMATCRAARPLS